jgi:hypothetical protein
VVQKPAAAPRISTDCGEGMWWRSPDFILADVGEVGREGDWSVTDCDGSVS